MSKNSSELLVSILTATNNSAATIARTIESVLYQDYPCIEYVIMDNDSDDGTVAIAESYSPLFQEKGFSFRIISRLDKGMYDALNKGAAMASGDLVGQINSDDWYEPDAVSVMVDLYEREHYDVAWASIRVRRRRGDFVKHARISRPWSTLHWCHPAMFSRREILLQYPYALESMFDDFDFITTVYRAEKKVVTLDRVISNFSYGYGGQSTVMTLHEVRRRVNATYSIYRKHGMSRMYLPYRWCVELFKYLLR